MRVPNYISFKIKKKKIHSCLYYVYFLNTTSLGFSALSPGMFIFIPNFPNPMTVSKELLLLLFTPFPLKPSGMCLNSTYPLAP